MIDRWTLPEAAAVPLTPMEALLEWGPVLVLAPHPDDEALGCGGLIAAWRCAGVPVEIVWLTDGRHSHPNSRAYPAERLIALRRAEAIASAQALGVERWHFFELEDARVPLPPSPVVVARLRELLQGVRVALTPWRLDPHCDHRAAYEYLAAAGEGLAVRLVEYPVWLWQNGEPADHPPHDQFEITRVAIEEVLPQKRAAIAAHRSQVTDLIVDDPDGFCVPAEMLAHFQQPWELFLSPR